MAKQMSDGFGLKKLRNLLAAGILTVSIFGCATHRETGALVETATGAGVNALSGYIVGSEADRVRQANIDREYKRLMQFDNKTDIKREIGRFGDYEFGDKNGRVDPVEEDRAYQGFLKKWKSELYTRELRKRPFIQVLEDYKGY